MEAQPGSQPGQPPAHAREWVEHHADALWRYALSKVRKPQIAEELVQETFLAAIASGDEFQGRSADVTWLIGILRNKIMDHYRRTARDRRGIGPEPAGAAGETPAGGGQEDFWSRMFTGKGLWKKEQIKLARQSAMDFSDRREFQIELAACGSAMPESLWEVFVLREALGVESDEICKRLEITPTNLWTRLHRARAALRDCLSAKGWWGGDKGKGKSAAT